MATIKKKGYAGKGHQEQEIITLANALSAFISRNSKVFTAVLAVAAVVLLAIAGYSLKRSFDEQKAGPLLAAAYEVYSRQAGETPDHARALDLFRDITKKYPSSRSGAVARYYAGNVLMDLGKHEEALKEYQAFTREYTRDELLLGLVYGRMGYLYRAAGKQQDAISAFERSESLMGPGMATVELARLYEAAGNSGEAQKKLKVIAEKLAGTSLARQVTGKAQAAGSLPSPAPAGGNPKPQAQAK